MRQQILWCYDDAHLWGKELGEAAVSRGYDVRFFDSVKQVHESEDKSYLFMHMHHHPAVRAIHKKMMAHFATRTDLQIIPDYRGSVLYDDKIEQLRQFAPYMPKTRLFRSPAMAREFLDTNPTYPFVSKTSEGSSSSNVRLIRTVDEARREIKQAFSDLGIKARYDRAQHGYLYWQDFIANNTHDIRVIAIGNQRLLLRRGNREDRPMASGSGINEPIQVLDDEAGSALFWANKFFAEEKQTWCGIDLVRDKVLGWRLLETTVGWSLHGYDACRFFGGAAMNDDGRFGHRIWDVFLDQLTAGVFG